MFCPECGSAIPDGSEVCEICGAVLTDMPAAEPKKKKRRASSEELMKKGERVSENIFLCTDGKFRWVYEMSLFRNPTIFVLVWKIFFFILLGIFALMSIVSLFDRYSPLAETLLNNLKFFGYFVLGMTALVLLGYLVYAAMMGGKYCVIFEMDEKGINHKQMAKQAKKAQLISVLTVLAGLASKNITTVGVGLNSTRTEMYTEFSRVRKVKAYPRRHLIKVNEVLNHNQVYAETADFDFVKSYITSHCDNLKK